MGSDDEITQLMSQFLNDLVEAIANLHVKSMIEMPWLINLNIYCAPSEGTIDTFLV